MHSHPILTDSSFKKGVYKTFEEFKNNAPSIVEFEIRKDAKVDVLHATENNQTFLLRDFWGYCDGTNIYINCADNFFQLFKSQHTFNVRGFKHLTRHKNIQAFNVIMWGPVLGTVGRSNKKIVYKGDITSMQLDMDTGELF